MPAGILAVFNDCAPEGFEHFERWYIREHLQERVGVPGFRFGRRYELVSGGDRRFFAFYEVETPAVLASHMSLRGCQGPANMAACPTETKAAGWIAALDRLRAVRG